MFKISQFKNTKTLIGLVYVCPVDSHFVIDYKVLTAFCWSSSTPCTFPQIPRFSKYWATDRYSVCFSSRKKKDIIKKIVFPYDHLVSVTLKYHRKNNFLIRYSTNEPPHNGHLGDRRKWPSNLWHIIFDRDPDSHFVIDGDLYTALCWSDHQVMVLILLRGTFGVGLRTRSTELGGDSRMHFMMDPSK